MAGPVTIIRKASPADARIVAELAAELWPEHTVEEFEQEMESLLADPECAVFLASAEDRPVALAQCQLRHDYVEGTESSPVGYLEGIFVSDAFRHQGIAGRLLYSCEEWARTMGCREFASDCELTNTASQSFHESIGFQEENRIVCYKKML